MLLKFRRKKPDPAPKAQIGGVLLIAEVTRAHEGEALDVVVGQIVHPVLGHGANCPALQRGDRAMAVLVEGGAVIVDRLRGDKDGPYLNPRDGRLEIAHEEVSIAAEGQMHIAGQRIDLN